MEIKRKKAMFFTLDAAISLLLIIAFIFLIYYPERPIKSSYYIEKDIFRLLSEIKVSEIENEYVTQLINEGKIKNLDNSLLEQIAEFYYTDKDLAKNLTKKIMENFKTNKNFGIWFNKDLIYAKNSTPYESSEKIQTRKQILTSLKSGENVTGYSARAFLTNSLKTDYHYFGGYVGDGNISLIVPVYGQLVETNLEIAINNNFSLYINGLYQGDYQKSENEFNPKSYKLNISHFSKEENLIEFKGKNLAISGGFVKISYLPEPVYYNGTKKYLQGVEGIINLYDGIFLPNFSSMEIYLHISAPQRLIFKLGNNTIYNKTPEGEERIILNDSYLSSILNYESISNKNIPIRLGFENISFVQKGKSYLISVVDLSGAISSARAEGCGNDGLCAVKKANYLLTENLFPSENTLLGLVGLYQGNVYPSYSHPLSNNKSSLNKTISEWKNNGALDLCFGIKNASETLKKEEYKEGLKAMILLGTTMPNKCLGSGTNVYQNTLNMACNVYLESGIIINTIGVVKLPADQELDRLLSNIANCTNGTYYKQNETFDLLKAYNKSLEELKKISYYLQTSFSNSYFLSKLYPDSYIKFFYNETKPKIGLTFSLEKNFQDLNKVNFSVPNETELISAEVLSYSGPRWTTEIYLNSINFYNLSRYGKTFTLLGDPFVFKIPLDIGQKENSINLYTGTSQENSKEAGSIYNKVVYKIIKNSSTYSGIKINAQGCNWKIMFENGNEITIKIPNDYSGIDNCSYLPSESKYDENDAYQVATYKLLKEMDFDNNKKIDFIFLDKDIIISSSKLSGIPFVLTDKIEVRTWY